MLSLRSPSSIPLRPTPTDPTVVRLEGEYWTIVYASSVVRMRDGAGLRHLAQLLWHPYREFRALDLMRALALAGGSRGGRSPRTDTAELDGSAANSYRRRISELQEELATAEDRHDLGQTGQLRKELDAILRELRHGVPGCLMKADAERARVAVTKTLKVALERIRAVHPALAGHLDATLKRGHVCVYRPDPRVPIRWSW